MVSVHSLLVITLWRVSLRNIEFGVLWEHMRLIDLPVSMFMDSFYDAYTRFIDPQSNGTYHTPYCIFHMLFGGIQFYILGWLTGIIAKRIFNKKQTDLC